MPSLGLALGLPFPQGLVSGDPLSKLLLALRLQTHARQVDHYEDGFLVSGAGSSEMNGPYSASPTSGVSYFKLDGSRRRIIDDPDAWRIQVENIANYYQATGDSPAGLSYASLDQGVNPPPSVTAIRLPFYKTVGLFKDITCTIRATQDGDSVAAWRDEWYFKLTGLFRGAIQANPIKQPKLRFFSGVPCLVFDGSDDEMFVSGAITLRDVFALANLQEGIVAGISSVNNKYAFFQLSDTLYVSDAVDPLQSTRVPSGMFDVFRGLFGSQGKLEVNGVTLDSGSLNIGSGELWIGRRGNQIGDQEPLRGSLISLLVSDQETDSVTARIYLDTLKP